MYLIRRCYILLMLLLFCTTAYAHNLPTRAPELGFQDTNYSWETIYKKGSDYYDVDVNHIYVEKDYRYFACMIRVGHGDSWKIYACDGDIDPFEELQDLNMNMMWKGPSPIPAKANSVQHGGKNYLSYDVKPQFDFQKKMTAAQHAIIKFIKDTVTFYPEKVIWVEDRRKRPLLSEYDYDKYGISPGTWKVR